MLASLLAQPVPANTMLALVLALLLSTDLSYLPGPTSWYCPMLSRASLTATRSLSQSTCCPSRTTLGASSSAPTVSKRRQQLGAMAQQASTAQNVLGGPLQCCCDSPYKTGFMRDGFCSTGAQDLGVHVVCAQVTAEFLEFTRGRGNDLSTPRPEYNFPGLKPGNRWCLCAERWREAMKAGVAPPVVLAATHARALEHVTLEELRAHAVPGEEVPA